MADHDHAYKLLFSHAPLVADLLRGFVGEDWVRHIDADTFERVGGGFVSDDLRERESDVIWRVRLGKESWIYVYLLLEFQSTVDLSMSLRVLTYVGLLYQDLYRQGVQTPSGRLPPVLPIVLYNGKRPWHAAIDAADLIEEVPGGLARHLPSLRFLLIDEARLADSDLPSERNLAAALFRMERSRAMEDVERVVTALTEWLQEPKHRELRRAFAIWLSQVLLPTVLPGVRIPAVEELQEVKFMLAENVKEWTREWKEQGREEGRQEGRQEALQEALQKALQAMRPVVLLLLEERFGSLPDEARRRIETAGSLEELAGLAERVRSAASLNDLGLA